MYRFMPVLIMLFALCLSTSAQETRKIVPPDYEEIETITNNDKSAYFYPTLLKRYMSNDTTLTLRELHLLYYGRFFQKGMESSFKQSKYTDSINAIYKLDTVTDEDRRRLTKYYLAIHKEKPFDIRTANRLYALLNYQKLSEAESYRYMVSGLMRVIAGTGDGRTEQTAFHIGSVSDEYTFVYLSGLDYGGSQSLINSCDYLTVKENDYDLEGVYFNIEQVLKEEQSLFGLSDMTKKMLEKSKKGKNK